MRVTQNTFEINSEPIVEIAEDFTGKVLVMLRDLNERLIDNPGASINERRELRRLEKLWDEFMKQAEQWTQNELEEAYLKGIEHANTQITGDIKPGGYIPFGPLAPKPTADE